MAVYNVKIVVTDEGTVKVQRDLEKLGSSAKKGGVGVDTLNDSLKRSKSGLTQFNVGNIAAQFQDIGVTAAMMQNPLQIALQQGTQLSAVFASSGGGLGAVLKQLGAAFAQVLSPISLLTIGLVAAVAAGLQMVDWAKVAYNVLTPLINILLDGINTLQQYPEILGAVGTAMLFAFGPTALGAVKALTVAIAGSLRTAIVSIFTLILSNPITAALTAVGALIGYVITKTIGWQQAIQYVIELWGKVVEVVGKATDALGITSSLAQTGLNIQLNAKQAAADILSSLDKGADYLKSALNAGKDALYEGAQAGAAAGAEDIKKSFDDGSTKAAKTQGTAIIDAGNKAGKSMGKSIEDAGSKITYNLSSAMSDLLVGFQAFGGDLLQAIDKARQIVDAQLAILSATADKLSAEAALARQQAQALRRGGSGSGGSGSGGSGSGNSLNNWHHPAEREHIEVKSFGGGGLPGIAPTGVDDEGNPILPGMRYSMEELARGMARGLTTGLRAPAPAATTSTTSSSTTHVEVILDPKSQLSAIETQAGKETIKRVITLNREEFQQLLGII